MPHSARRATASRLEDRDQTESKTRQRGAHLDPIDTLIKCAATCQFQHTESAQAHRGYLLNVTVTGASIIRGIRWAAAIFAIVPATILALLLALVLTLMTS